MKKYLFLWFGSLLKLPPCNAPQKSPQQTQPQEMASTTTWILAPKINQIVLPLTLKQPYNPEKSYTLSFEDVKANPLPDGVYEIYLVSERPKGLLSEGSASFVNVLDLYTLQSQPKIPIQLPLLPSNTTGIKMKHQGETCFLVIQFRGNVLPNQSPLPHSGSLTGTKIRLTQSD